MHSIAKARRTKRYSSGAVSLNNPQLYVERNEEGYPVVRHHTPPRTPTPCPRTPVR